MKKLTSDYEKQFLEFAALHHDLSSDGKGELSNKAHGYATSAIGHLMQNKVEGISFLEKATQDTNPSVRLWAAAYLLPHNENVALGVLSQLKMNDVPWQVQTTSEVIVEQWKSGSLELVYS